MCAAFIETIENYVSLLKLTNYIESENATAIKLFFFGREAQPLKYKTNSVCLD